SLLQLLDKGSIPAERQPVLIETVCRYGGARELKAVWDQALRADGYPPELRRRVLGWLAEAAVTRRVLPAVKQAAVRQLLQETAGDAVLLPEAVHLATAWKVKAAA